MRTKVLPLEFWMTDKEMLEDCLKGGKYDRVEPHFNRPGIYRNGDQCWFETSDGRAYTYPVSQFAYEMRILDAERISIKQADALAEVVKQRLATPAQRALLNDYRGAMEIRNTYRQSRLSVLRVYRDYGM